MYAALFMSKKSPVGTKSHERLARIQNLGTRVQSVQIPRTFPCYCLATPARKKYHPTSLRPGSILGVQKNFLVDYEKGLQPTKLTKEAQK